MRRTQDREDPQDARIPPQPRNFPSATRDAARAPEPMLITSAAESSEHEFDRRKRKYAITMSIRAACVLAAVATFHFSLLLALAFIVGGMVLPWMAVVVANDGPVKKRRAVKPHRQAPGGERALTSGADRVVDG